MDYELFEARLCQLWRQSLMLLGMAVLICGIAWLYRPGTQAAGLWFARAGAPATVLSLLAENRLRILKDHLTPVGGYLTHEINIMILRYRSHLKIGSWLIIACTAWGTAIWGYGDILWNVVHRHPIWW